MQVEQMQVGEVWSSDRIERSDVPCHVLSSRLEKAEALF